MKKGGEMGSKIRTPVKAIRAKCLDCSCWQPKEVRFCPVEDCPLYPYRFGKNPRRSRKDYKRGIFHGKSPPS